MYLLRCDSFAIANGTYIIRSVGDRVTSHSARGTHMLHITNLRMIDDPYVTHYYRNLWNIKYEIAVVPLSLVFVMTKGSPHGISPPT